jgi:hypothetical protein
LLRLGEDQNFTLDNPFPKMGTFCLFLSRHYGNVCA